VTVATLLVALATASNAFVLIMIRSSLRGEVCMLIASSWQEFGFLVNQNVSAPERMPEVNE
jgi:hypothetical protein